MPNLLKYKNRGGERGFTLAEAVVSAIILGIAVGAMLGVFVIGRVSAVKAKYHIQVTNLIQSKMEELKNLIYDDVSTVSAQNIIIDIGQDLASGTSDDLVGQISVDVRDKYDIDNDTNTTETEIDVTGDGTNDTCKAVYVTISWTSPRWGGSGTVTEEFATLISK